MEIEKLYLLKICQALLKQGESWQVTVSNHVACFCAVRGYGEHCFPAHLPLTGIEAD